MQCITVTFEFPEAQDENAMKYSLAKDMVPINTIQNEVFNKITTMDKHYAMPSCHCFSNVALSALYSACRAKVKTELCNVQNFVATSDFKPNYGTLSDLDGLFHYK